MEPNDLRALPKVLLHEHLDGGLRASTLLELLEARGIAHPARDAAGLAAWFDARAHAGSLVEYLRGFALTVAAMASAEALERVAFEAAEDARDDGCVLAEFRIAPLLFEPLGVPPDEAIGALVAGLARSALPCGLILCAMREHPAAQSERVAALAARHLGRGVIGFDLAGPEPGHPPSDHVRAFAAAREAGVPITCHAGEADDGARVIEAARLGAVRIGHGVRLADAIGSPGGQALVEEARERGLHFELCPTSNVHTGAVASLAQHPIRAMRGAGLSVSFHTDNRLISRTSMSAEAAALMNELGLGEDDLADMAREAARHAFLPGVSGRML